MTVCLLALMICSALPVSFFVTLPATLPFASIVFVAVEWSGAGVSPPAGEWRYGRPAAKALRIIDP
jgi:hypothetical protein